MSTEKRQVFSPEFKREAVVLLEKGDKNVAQLARELGVKRTHLHRWKEALDAYGRDAFPGAGKRNRQTPGNETARLRAENRRLQGFLCIQTEAKSIMLMNINNCYESMD